MSASGGTAVSLRAVLAHLAGRHERRREDPSVQTPPVGLTLEGGQMVSGIVLALAEAAGTVLLASSEPGDRSYSVVRVASINAAQLESDDEIDELFGGGRLRPSVAPTKLELARRAESLAEGLASALENGLAVQVRWPDFPRTDVAMTELGASLDDIGVVLRGLADDELGREALRPLEAVELRRGATAAAARDGATLRLTLAVRGDRMRSPTADMVEGAL